MMPKNRKRAAQKGAKSEAITTKHKIGGRKSSKGVVQLSTKELKSMLNNVRKRDRNMLRRQLEARGYIVTV